MDTSGSQEPFQPSRRRPRSSRSTSSHLTRPAAAGEAVSGQRLFGRIDAVHQTPDGEMVELFRAMEPVAHLPIALFPSPDWVKANLGRWVAMNGRADGVKVMPGPNEICRHATDPGTRELRLLCGICGTEMGRLPPLTPKMDARAMTQRIGSLLRVHLSMDHPETLAMFNDPWRNRP